MRKTINAVLVSLFSFAAVTLAAAESTAAPNESLATPIGFLCEVPGTNFVFDTPWSLVDRCYSGQGTTAVTPSGPYTRWCSGQYFGSLRIRSGSVIRQIPFTPGACGPLSTSDQVVALTLR
ncbi:hypothetical protein JOF56_006060 [Kibdelosporangium banguiense]|uniref:Peptidase inhibitor family I36 n=1 Tax=Kibdelosporangium banguiense TaxID=1365924 RepID=A0ABS4TMP0_9PSEU|nr:hypothetical protein [Kibdelosporangium banguiense]MBP2325675.1 hypothetical protein [Kibdelosporangium banguiense]